MSKRWRRPNLENDCLAILLFCEKNPDFYQTVYTLAEALNMPPQRVSYILSHTLDVYGPNDWCLAITAERYGLDFKVDWKKGKIIYVWKKL